MFTSKQKMNFLNMIALMISKTRPVLFMIKFGTFWIITKFAPRMVDGTGLPGVIKCKALRAHFGKEKRYTHV